jgi:two-component system CheB/CheR fusion protein
MTDAGTEQSAELEDLLNFLREARGFDFTGYKRSSLARRILKRMHDVDVEHYPDYRDLLETNGAEFDELFDTILINVTGFFRDPSAWQVLQQEVVPDIVAMASPDDEIRVWSAGCSSGEEAYSLAIAFAEAMGVPAFLDRVKIYATDVDEQALQRARTGLYTGTALEGLADGLVDTYFEARGEKFAVRPDVRRRVIFGRHDITRDAPISRLHLLACRNTLMYFNVETQSSIVDRLHFALRDNGYLFLGKAEMLLSDSSRFEIANMRQRIFRRRADELALPRQPALRFESLSPIGTLDDDSRRQLRDVVLDVAPDGIIALDLGGTVALVNSQARTTLGLSRGDIGRPFRDLEVSYRPTELRSLIERAQLERRPLRVNAIEVRRSVDESEYYDVLIQPLSAADGAPLGTSLVFVDTTHATRLQQELKRNREDLETAYEELQSTNEELETTNEELQSSIEELETTNEELQSTNEELETTNEKLQSTNEELETMNEEMRIRSSDLDEGRAFLEAILTSVAASVIVLDANLTVRTWNRGAQDMWGLRTDEAVDHPFFELDFGLPTAQLRAAVQDCLATGQRQQLLELHAVNRLGRGIVSSVACSPLDGRANQGVVLLMEELRDES